MEIPVHPLGVVSTVEEAEGTHAALAVGYRC